MIQQTNAIAPEDLRPGVWLIDPNGSPFEVEFLYKDGDAWCVKSVYDDDTDEQLINCSPIPLSPEVLTAAGFYEGENSGKLYWWQKWGRNGMHIVSFFNGDYWLDLSPSFTQHVDYLHRLQNICRCTSGEGFELNINAAQLAEAVKGKNT